MMTEAKKITRKEYIESELKRWNEHYEIGFQDEFDLKAMLDLQYQFMITPMEHIKTIGDIVHTKNQIMKNLNLKPKYRSSYNPENWIVDLGYSNKDNSRYEMVIIKTNPTNGKVKTEKMSRFDGNFNDLASLLLSFVQSEKPSKLMFDTIGIGMGIYDATLKLIKTDATLVMKDNGDLIYINQN